MKRTMYDSSKQHHRSNPKRLKRLLGYALLLACLGYPYRDAVYFNNGAGGAEWTIGQPKVTLWTAHQSRTLPELRAFALELINRDRRLNGLPPLVEDSLLTQAAQRHAEDVSVRNSLFCAESFIL